MSIEETLNIRPIIADQTLAKDIANRSRKVITKLNEIIEKLINEK